MNEYIELLKAKFTDADDAMLQELAKSLADKFDAEKQSFLDEQTKGLISNRDTIKAEKDALKEQLAAIAKEKEEALMRSGDIEQIKASLAAEHDKAMAEKQAVIDSLINGSVKEKNDALLADISLKINKDYPAAVKAVLRDMVKTTYENGEFKQSLINQDGTPFTGSNEEFVKAFCENKEYANIIGSNMGGAQHTETRTETQQHQPNKDFETAKKSGNGVDYLAAQLQANLKV